VLLSLFSLPPPPVDVHSVPIALLCFFYKNVFVLCSQLESARFDPLAPDPWLTCRKYSLIFSSSGSPKSIPSFFACLPGDQPDPLYRPESLGVKTRPSLPRSSEERIPPPDFTVVRSFSFPAMSPMTSQHRGGFPEEERSPPPEVAFPLPIMRIYGCFAPDPAFW